MEFTEEERKRVKERAEGFRGESAWSAFIEVSKDNSLKHIGYVVNDSY